LTSFSTERTACGFALLAAQMLICYFSMDFQESRRLVIADCALASYTLPGWRSTLQGDAMFEAHSLESRRGTSRNRWLRW